MPEPFSDTLATVAAGRTALVARLRAIAARVEALPLDAAAEVLVLLEPAMAALERHAALALERAPARHHQKLRRLRVLLPVHGLAQLPSHEHREPAESVVGILRDEPPNQLDQCSVELNGSRPLPAIVQRRARQPEPPAQLRDRHHLPLRTHRALHR
jgi:hypothetical protein